MRIPVKVGDSEPVERRDRYEAETYRPEQPGGMAEEKQEQAEERQEPVGETEQVEREEAAAPEVDYKDLYLRAMAENANFRRRTEERALEQVEGERCRLLRGFLEFADNLERALEHIDEPGLREGIRLTYEGLNRFLEKEGVEEVAAHGQQFNPELHEAVATREGTGQEDQVVEQVQRGYCYHGRLLRPARVVVGR